VPSPIDEVGPWTEVKIEIVREYAGVFQQIVKAQPFFHPIYMDGFSGAGILVSESSGGPVAGTPARIVEVVPPFAEYHFIEKDPAKERILRASIGKMPNVTIHLGDSNKILLDKILPTMTYGSYRKGLLFLDPYGLHLDWEVVEAAGKSACVDLLLNFPIMDMNRNVLRGDPSSVPAMQVERMNRFFGDERAWRDVVYEEPLGLFGPMPPQKRPGNESVVQAYLRRLKDIAGFKYVSTPLAMKNEVNSVVYYLIGASQVPQGVSVCNSVFKKWQKKGVRIVPTEHDRVD
jgi:three-Cys-motif partner protein